MELKRDSELQLWRFALALMGGRRLVWMFIGAMLCVITALVFVATQPVYPLSRPMLYIGMAKMFAVACFLALPLAAAHLYAQCRLHPMLHLMPGADWRLRALLRRMVALAALVLIAAMYLQMFMVVADRTPPDSLIAVASVQSYEWRAWLLYMLGAAAFIWFGASKLRAPLNFVWAPAYMFSMQTSLRMWWWPLAVAVVFVGLPWLYQRLSGEPPKRQRMLDENTYMVLPDTPPTGLRMWLERWRAWQLRRVLRAPPHKRMIVLAAMSQPTPFALNWVAALLFGYAVAFVPVLSPAVWGNAFNMMLGMIALPIVVPGPVTLAPLWLLPVGLYRDRWGELLVATWMRRVRVRIVCGMIIGACLLVARSLFLPEWGQFMWRDVVAPTFTERYLLPPILLAVLLHGVAFTVFALVAMWPPTSRRRRLEWLPPVVMLATPIVMGVGLVAADIVAASWMRGLPGIAIYVGAFGVVFPAVAWGLLRLRRHAWAQTDIAAVSARFNAWGVRIAAATTFDREDQAVQVSRSADGQYAVRR